MSDIEEEPVKSGSSNPLAPVSNTAATAPPPRVAARKWEGEDEDEDDVSSDPLALALIHGLLKS